MQWLKQTTTIKLQFTEEAGKLLDREEWWPEKGRSGGHKSQRPGWEWEGKGNKGGAVQ